MRCWTKAFLSKGVRIRTSHPPVARVLDQLLATLPGSVSEPTLEFTLETVNEGCVVGFPDGSEQVGDTVWDAFYALESFVYDRILPEEQDCLVVHGAAVFPLDSSGVLLIAGPSHCGKSTLSLALVSAGDFRYMSEEAFGIRLNGSIVAYPKPFRIRFGGECLVADRPEWIVAGRTGTGIRYVLPPSEVVSSRAEHSRIRWLLFPKFVADSRCEAERMAKAEAVAWLANCSTNRPEFLASQLRRLPEWLEEAEAWRLQWSDPGEVVRFVRSLIRDSRSTEFGAGRDASPVPGSRH